MGPTTGKLTRRGFLAGTAGALVAAPFLSAAQAGAAVPSGPGAYDAAVLQDRPVGFWRMAGAATGSEPDASGNGLTGTYAGGRSLTTLPNGDGAADFDGSSGCLEIPDNRLLSPETTGRFTIEAWIRPDTLEFRHVEAGDNYVHWLGKGSPNQHEYVARMYSKTNIAGRPNRISGYAFNPDGGRGAGSYFQEPVSLGEWIHYVLVINAADKSDAFPDGYTQIYRNGDGPLDKRNLKIDQDVIHPQDGTAPLRVGTRDRNSWFEGAIGKVAVYDFELRQERIQCHRTAMLS